GRRGDHGRQPRSYRADPARREGPHPAQPPHADQRFSDPLRRSALCAEPRLGQPQPRRRRGHSLGDRHDGRNRPAPLTLMDHSLTPSHESARSLLPTPTPPPASTPSAAGSRIAGDAHDLLGILHRNVWWIVGCTVVCLTAALLYVALVRPSYTAAASVRIDDRREQDQAPGLSALGLTGGNEVNTEIEMLRSRMLAQAVVDSLGLQLRLTAPRWATRDRALVVRHVDRDAPASIYSLRPEGRDGFTLRNDSTGKTLGHVVPGADLPIPGLDIALSAYARGLGTITFRVANYD